MTLQSARLAASGAQGHAVITGGIKAAFLCGAILSLGAVVTAFFIKKPEASVAGAVAGH